jgi:hypothetical protein
VRDGGRAPDVVTGDLDDAQTVEQLDHSCD